MLEAYAEVAREVAWEVADSLYPPEPKAVKSSARVAKSDDMVISHSASRLRKPMLLEDWARELAVEPSLRDPCRELG